MNDGPIVTISTRKGADVAPGRYKELAAEPDAAGHTTASGSSMEHARRMTKYFAYLTSPNTYPYPS